MFLLINEIAAIDFYYSNMLAYLCCLFSSSALVFGALFMFIWHWFLLKHDFSYATIDTIRVKLMPR